MTEPFNSRRSFNRATAFRHETIILKNNSLPPSTKKKKSNKKQITPESITSNKRTTISQKSYCSVRRIQSIIFFTALKYLISTIINTRTCKIVRGVGFLNDRFERDRSISLNWELLQILYWCL